MEDRKRYKNTTDKWENPRVLEYGEKKSVVHTNVSIYSVGKTGREEVVGSMAGGRHINIPKY